MATITNKQKLEALRELNKRKKNAEYSHNFELFAKEQIKILPKDSSKGFQPFVFNEAQLIVNAALEKQLKETGKVRAIILKARQMGLSTFTTARVFWKSLILAQIERWRNALHMQVERQHGLRSGGEWRTGE